MYIHLVRQLYALLIVRLTTAIRTTTRLQRVANGLMALALLAALALAGAIGMGGYYLSSEALKEAPALGHLIVLDAMVILAGVFWLWSLVLDVQRNDTFDVRAVLTLPVTPWLVVLLNYLLSLVSFIMFLFPPLLTGYVVGLHAAQGAPLFGVLAPVLFFILALAGWVYYLRGLIAVYMEDKRRRRVLLMVLPMAFVILSQMPLLVINLMGDNLDAFLAQLFNAPEVQMAVRGLNVAIPLGWMPYAIYAAREGLWFQSVLACGGVGILWLMSLRLAYRATLRYYRGETNIGSRRREAGPPRRYATLRRLPFLDDTTSGLAWTTFLNMARHPQVRMMLVMPLVLALIMLFSATAQERNMRDRLGDDEFLEQMDLPRVQIMPALFVFLPFMNLAMVMFNQFGYDSNGFRGLLLLPVERRRILLARNLSFAPFLGILCVAFIAPALWLVGASVQQVTIAFLQTGQLFLLFCVVGNYLSILSPYRVGRDSMRGAGNRAMLMLLSLLALVAVIILALPSLFCMTVDSWFAHDPRWSRYPVGLLLSGALLSLTVPIYVVGLKRAARLFAAREQRMLATLVREAA